MDTLTVVVLTIAAFVVLGIVAAITVRNRRLEALKAHAKFIQQYSFPAELRNILQRDSGLSLAQSGQVLEALKQYFLACLSAKRSGIGKSLGMPSKAVDDAWHQFILMTREYEKFCLGAFGEYLHHTPQAMASEPDAKALANTLHQLKQPALSPAGWAMLGTMPLLFALDRELGVTGGHIYDDTALQDLERQRQFFLASSSSSDSHSSSGDSGSSDSGSSDSGSSWFSWGGGDSSSGSDSGGGGSSCSGGGGGDS